MSPAPACHAGQHRCLTQDSVQEEKAQFRSGVLWLLMVGKGARGDQQLQRATRLTWLSARAAPLPRAGGEAPVSQLETPALPKCRHQGTVFWSGTWTLNHRAQLQRNRRPGVHLTASQIHLQEQRKRNPVRSPPERAEEPPPSGHGRQPAPTRPSGRGREPDGSRLCSPQGKDAHRAAIPTTMMP